MEYGMCIIFLYNDMMYALLCDFIQCCSHSHYQNKIIYCRQHRLCSSLMAKVLFYIINKTQTNSPYFYSFTLFLIVQTHIQWTYTHIPSHANITHTLKFFCPSTISHFPKRKTSCACA